MKDKLKKIIQASIKESALIEEGLINAFDIEINQSTQSNHGDFSSNIALKISGKAKILVGTQMLTKGHDFANLSMVAIVNADQGIFGSDFRSGERFAQHFFQV